MTSFQPISAMQISTSVTLTTSIAIAIFLLPPLLKQMFFAFLILAACVSHVAAVAATAFAPRTAQICSTLKKSRNPEGPKSASGVRYVCLIASGGSGSVYVAEMKPSDEQPASVFAAKVMDKSTPHKAAKAMMELEILKMLDHPFLPKLHSAVDSPTELCLLMELCPAGSLDGLRQLFKRFPSSAVRFYAAEVVVALEYLHMMGIVHRDLKPENILIRRDGHIMLTDFDISLKCNDVVSTLVNVTPYKKSVTARHPDWLIPSCFRPTKRKPRKNNSTKFQFSEFVAEPVDARSMSFVGTYEYMAPEVVNRDGHGSTVDWWTLGILMYEMFYGRTPFLGVDWYQTMNNIGVRALDFPKQPDVPAAAKDLMTQLLVKEPADRLGSTMGASAIKSHPFFHGVNWALLRSIAPPFVPHPSLNNYSSVTGCCSLMSINSTNQDVF